MHFLGSNDWDSVRIVLHPYSVVTFVRSTRSPQLQVKSMSKHMESCHNVDSIACSHTKSPFWLIRSDPSCSVQLLQSRHVDELQHKSAQIGPARHSEVKPKFWVYEFLQGRFIVPDYLHGHPVVLPISRNGHVESPQTREAEHCADEKAFARVVLCVDWRSIPRRFRHLTHGEIDQGRKRPEEVASRSHRTGFRGVEVSSRGAVS